LNDNHSEDLVEILGALEVFMSLCGKAISTYFKLKMLLLATNDN